MSRSSARRGQVEPLAAIVAVFAVCAGLGLYAGTLDGALPERDEASAHPALHRVERAVADGGVVDPRRLPDSSNAVGSGRRVNATLVTAEQRWTVGPTAPGTARNATVRVSVRTAPGSVRPGRLTVRVWP